MKELVSQEKLIRNIFLIRGQKVMLDFDLANLYGISTGRLNEQVKRNIKRFPFDFMFRLTKIEYLNLLSQNAISSSSYGGSRYPPFAFTEQGVAMLSSVLNSDRAIQVNVIIMRVFVKLRTIFAEHRELALKLDQLESKVGRHDEEISNIFTAIHRLMAPPDKPGRKIGFLNKL